MTQLLVLEGRVPTRYPSTMNTNDDKLHGELAEARLFEATAPKAPHAHGIGGKYDAAKHPHGEHGYFAATMGQKVMTPHGPGVVHRAAGQVPNEPHTVAVRLEGTGKVHYMHEQHLSAHPGESATGGGIATGVIHNNPQNNHEAIAAEGKKFGGSFPEQHGNVSYVHFAVGEGGNSASGVFAQHMRNQGHQVSLHALSSNGSGTYDQVRVTHKLNNQAAKAEHVASTPHTGNGLADVMRKSGVNEPTIKSHMEFVAAAKKAGAPEHMIGFSQDHTSFAKFPNSSMAAGVFAVDMGAKHGSSQVKHTREDGINTVTLNHKATGETGGTGMGQGQARQFAHASGRAGTHSTPTHNFKPGDEVQSIYSTTGYTYRVAKAHDNGRIEMQPQYKGQTPVTFHHSEIQHAKKLNGIGKSYPTGGQKFAPNGQML